MNKTIYTFCGGVSEKVGPKVWEKDIVSVGEYYLANGRKSVFTLERLNLIKKNYDLYTGRGNRVPVVWDHSLYAIDTVGYVVSLWIENKTLKGRLTINDQEALSKIPDVVDQVSIGLASNYVDGVGNEYDDVMIHLGVTNIPVVPNQGPFIPCEEFSKKSNNLILLSKEVINMADDTIPVASEDTATEETSSPKLSKMTLADVANDPAAFEDLKELINNLLAAAGSTAQLDDDVEPDDFLKFLCFIGKGFPDVSADADDSESDSSADVVSPEMPVDQAMSKSNKAVQEVAERLSKLEKDFLGFRKDAYHLQVDNLLSRGSILPSKKATLIEAGKEENYDLSLLSAFNGKSLDTRKTPKPVVDEKKERTVEEIHAKFGLK